jgi:hypothetical protein
MEVRSNPTRVTYFFIVACSCKFVTGYIISMIKFLGKFFTFISYKNEPIRYPTSVVERIIVKFDIAEF